jgi:outer membrane protein
VTGGGFNALACGVFAAAMGAVSLRCGAQTFDEALAQAYLYNPQLGVARQRLRETDEGVPRALSGWRPRVNIAGSIGVSAIQDSMDPVHDPERRVPQESALTVTQPVYTGGRVSAQVAQAEVTVRAQRAQLRATESAVLLAAASAYLDVARDQRVVALDRNNVQLLERTLRATEQQVAAGEVTETDAAQARARLADGRATLAVAEGQLASSQAIFQQQVGTLPGSLDLPYRHFTGLPPNRDVAVSLAVDNNFDVVAARETQEASRLGVDVARAGLYPTVTLQGMVGRVKETDVQAPHQRDNVAEATVQVSIPLYQGGLISAETRQAKEAAERARLQGDQAQRQARQLAITAWELLAAAAERVHEQRASVAANEIALRGITRQQEVGARTLLEVLNAQQELFAANVNLVSAQHDEVLSELRELAAVGRLTAEHLALPAPIYDPVRHYRETRDRWGGNTPAP